MVKNKIQISKNYHIQPSEIDRLPYFEYEWYIEEIKEIQKEEEAKNEEESKHGNIPSLSSLQNQYKNMTSPSMQSIPNLPQIHIPTI